MLDFVGVDRDRIVGLKQLLVKQVEGSSDWRARKALEYHDNAGSNLRASEDLLALAKSLDDLADDDPLWLTYACAIETADEFIYLAGWLAERLQLIGFYESATDGREFLRELLREMAGREAA